MKNTRTVLLILAGLALGVGLGLFIAWGLLPTQYVDTSPASLRTDFKDDYRSMIALAFRANNDLIRAQARLSTIGDTNPIDALGSQTQRMIGKQAPMDSLQVLADLSQALQATPTATVTVTPQPDLPTPIPPTDTTPTQTTAALLNSQEPQGLPTETATLTPVPAPIDTLAPHPRPTATNTPGPTFELTQQTSLCEPSQPGLLQIYLSDSKGKPVAGVEVVVTWFGGEEHFFSGLKSEISPGYADMVLSENVEYDLSISPTGTRVTGLRTTSCPDASGGEYPGGIRLEFKQP